MTRYILCYRIVCRKRRKVMISKEDFVKLMNELSEKRESWEKLQDVMEELSPGEYVNFWPYFFYEETITNLLRDMFGYTDKDEDTPLDWFMIEGSYGKNPSEIKGFETAEKLYDLLIKEKEERENGQNEI